MPSKNKKTYTEIELTNIENSFKTENPIKIRYTDAKKNGLNLYFTGGPCLRGHISLRFVSNRGCVKCSKDKKQRERHVNINDFTPVNNKTIIKDRLKNAKKTKIPNDIKDMGDYIIVYIKSKNKIYEVFVDRNDYFNTVKHYRWVMQNGYTGITCKNRTTKISSTILMHQLIMMSTHIDHLDGNKLNNRKNNLVLSNNFLNCLNKKYPNQTKWGYKGVQKYSKTSFIAMFHYFNKRIHLGSYPKLIMAAMAYDHFASDVLKEHAILNKIHAKNYWEDFSKLTQNEINHVYINEPLNKS